MTGTVNGSSIQFGSVKRQCQVDYTGSIDGDQMSGTYNISGAPGGTLDLPGLGIADFVREELRLDGRAITSSA
jgi:hypothetical protein